MRCYHCNKDFSNRRDKGGYYAVESWDKKLIRIYCKKCSEDKYRDDWPVIIRGRTAAVAPAPNDWELEYWMRFLMRNDWTILQKQEK